MSLFFPTKDERRNQHKVILAIIIPLLILFYLFTPTYPEIKISSSLLETQKSAMHHITMYTLIMHPQTVEERKEYENLYNSLVIKLDNCKNTECVVAVYEECMDDYGSSDTRKMARSKFMIDKFGIVGESINENLGFMY